MTDIIWGVAEWVHDGASFMLRVTHTRRANRLSYAKVEKVHVTDVAAPGLHEPGGKVARRRMIEAVYLQKVRCEISARTADGQLQARVILEHPEQDTIADAA